MVYHNTGIGSLKVRARLIARRLGRGPSVPKDAERQGPNTFVDPEWELAGVEHCTEVEVVAELLLEPDEALGVAAPDAGRRLHLEGRQAPATLENEVDSLTSICCDLLDEYYAICALLIE